MPQLNALPINIPQGIEIKEEGPSVFTTSSGEGFSQLIDQHMTSNQGCAYQEKPNKSQQPIENKDSTQDEDTVQPKVRVEEMNSGLNGSETKQQDIAAGGKEIQTTKERAVQNNDQSTAINSVEDEVDNKTALASDRLMSFLQKADSALQKPNLNAEQLAGLSDEEIAVYEQSIQLSHNKIIEGTAGSPKLLSGQQLEQNVAQNSGQLVTHEKLKLSSLSDRINIDKSIAQLPVEPIIKAELTGEGISDKATAESELLSSKNLTTTATAIKAAVSAPTANSKEQAINSLINLGNVEVSDEGIAEGTTEGIDEALLQQKSLANAFAQDKQVNDIHKTQTLSDEEIIAAKNKVEQLGAEQVVKNTKTTIEQGVATDAVAQFKQSISAFEKRVSELAQANNSPSNQSDDESLQANEQLGSKVLTSEQTALNQAVSDQANRKINAEKNEQVSILNNGQNFNKLATSASMTSANQVQASAEQASQTQKLEQQQQNSIEALVEENQEEIASLPKGKNELGEKVEDKSAQQLKASLSANASFTDVSARATQVASQTAEQQAIEQLSPAVTSEVTQSQKTNAQLHQETISIFRKDFSDAVKDKVMLMISQKLQQFDIKLDPPELGNMQVRVNLQSEQAAVNFVVQNQQAKEALEQNMHKLRDMLAQQGVDVGDANVEQQSQQSGSDEFSDNANSQQMEETANANDVVEHTLSGQVINASANAVDYYA